MLCLTSPEFRQENLALPPLDAGKETPGQRITRIRIDMFLENAALKSARRA
jgi:hypothetical protein